MEAAAPEGPVHIAAHDWGGPIALGWAVRNPHRVASVTLMNTGLRLPFGYKLPWRLAIFKRLAPLGSLLAVRGNLFAWGTACFGAQALKSEARREILAPYREASQRLAIGKFVEDIPLSPEHPSYQTLADIDMRAEKLLAEKPFQLVWGLRDFVFNRRVFLDWRERFPEAPFLALPEAGHYLMEDEPERVAEAVKDFISRARRP